MRVACVSLWLFHRSKRTTEALRWFCRDAICYVGVVHAGSAQGRSEAGYAGKYRVRTPSHFLFGRAQHHHGSAACRSTSSVAAVGTAGHGVRLPRSVAAMSASLAASIIAICSSTSVMVCIADRRLVCSYTRVGRGRDHDHPRLLS